MPRTRLPLLLLLLLPLLPLVTAAASPARGQGIEGAARDAQAAAARGDLAGQRHAMQRAAALAPGHPWVLYNLARAHALAGHRDSALRALAVAARIGFGADPAADSAFAALRALPAFAALRDTARARARPIVASDTAFVVRQDGLVPENVAHDPITGGFLVGDLRGRRILHRAADGTVRELAGPDVVRGMVLGMKPDRARGLLWVNVASDTAGMTGAERRSLPRAALLALDLRTGALRHRHVPADSLAPHLFNDLVLARDGAVLLTDSEAGIVYRLDAPGGTAREWLRLPRETISYPNGIALAPDERTLYVAHGEGTSAIDVATRRLRRLQPPPGFTLAGFDGLYAVGDLLVGIQNGGLDLDRVVAFRVDRDGRVGAVRELERRHPAYHVPTTGAMVGDTLYYIANAQLDRMPAPGRPAPPPPDPVIVLRLAIPRALAPEGER